MSDYYGMHGHVETSAPQTPPRRAASAAALLANLRTMELRDDQTALDARVHELETLTAQNAAGQRMSGAGLARYEAARAVGIDEQTARALGVTAPARSRRPSGRGDAIQTPSGRPLIYYPGERRSWRDLT